MHKKIIIKILVLVSFIYIGLSGDLGAVKALGRTDSAKSFS